MSIEYTDSRNVNFGQVAKVLAGTMKARKDWDEVKTREAFLNSAYAVYALDGERLRRSEGHCRTAMRGR